MIAIQKFDMHLDRPEKKLRICGVQGDALSRGVCFLMYHNGRGWPIPADVRVAVWYVKADRTGGMYDALPDGTPAWGAAGNALTVYLAPQMFTAAGEVQIQLELRCGEAVLHSFAFILEVSHSLPLAEGSQDYFHWQYAFLPQTDSAEAGQLLQVTAVDVQGRVMQVRGTEIQGVGGTGTTFIPMVDEAGNLSWSNDGGLANPETVNLMGPAGEPGEPGPQGPAGEAGYSPVRGTDYWTEEDKVEIREYCLPQPATAAAGQFLKVTAVDEGGKVTAVEATDAPTLPGAEGVAF